MGAVKDHLESSASKSFDSYRKKPWQMPEELPSARLDADGFRAFWYAADFVADYGPREPRDVIWAAEGLLDDFPYTDRTASGAGHTGRGGILAVSLEIPGYDQWDDTEELALAWVPEDDEGILLILNTLGQLDELLDEPAEVSAVERFDDVVLGDG